MTELTIRTKDGAESIPRLEVTPDFLDLLGIVPALGRRFSADDLDAGAGSVAMLGYDFW